MGKMVLDSDGLLEQQKLIEDKVPHCYMTDNCRTQRNSWPANQLAMLAAIELAMSMRPGDVTSIQ